MITAIKIVTTVLNKLLTKVQDFVFCKYEIKILEPARHLWIEEIKSTKLKGVEQNSSANLTV